MKQPEKNSFWALMATQFFGAFNDNVLKIIVTLLIVQWVNDVDMRNSLVDFSGAVFVAPFLLFSMVAGRISDRVGKPRVIVATKFWELLVVSVAVFSFWLKSIPVMMVSLFLLSTQAAFFSPAKYGVLPELMGTEELSQANGWLNVGTFSAILMGTIIGSFVSRKLMMASFIMGGASVAGIVASFFMETLPASKPGEPWAWDPFQDLLANWRIMRQDRALKLGSIAVNYFWFMGAVLQLNIFIYAKEMLNATPEISGMLLMASAVGIGIGSFLAGELSENKVELGWVPLGALGMSLFTMDLLFSYHSMTRTLFDFFMMGMSGGFFDIPLSALVQWRSPIPERGRILATINFFSFVAILMASVALWVLGNGCNLNAAQIFFALGAVSLVGLVAVWWAIPEIRRHFFALVRDRLPS